MQRFTVVKSTKSQLFFCEEKQLCTDMQQFHISVQSCFSLRYMMEICQLREWSKNYNSSKFDKNLLFPKRKTIISLKKTKKNCFSRILCHMSCVHTEGGLIKASDGCVLKPAFCSKCKTSTASSILRLLSVFC